MSFFLKKAISYFILPPGIFIVLLLIPALFLKNRFLRIYTLFLTLLLYLISIEPVKDLLYIPLEKPYMNIKEAKGDVIVVLGGGVSNRGELKRSSIKRLLGGFLLHKETGLPIVLSGGKATGLVEEAKIMKELLIKLGVEESRIFTDTRSRDTRENALYVKKICEEIKCSEIILVTSAFHMRRALETFKKAGLNPNPYPVDFRYEGRYNIYSFFPKSSAFEESSIAIREYIGIILYKLFY